jgi:uncharacterized protein (TIGR02271 family)
MDERNEGDRVLPVLTERLALDTTREEVGALRVRIESASRRESVEGAERIEQALVQRVPRDVEVDAAKPPWTEGETLVVPVYAERVELRRSLILTEEIRIVRRALERPASTEAIVRSERAVVERRQPDGSWCEVAVESEDMAGSPPPP